MSILDWVKILNGLSDSERENLALFCQEKHLDAWEELFHEDEEASAMYILKDWNIVVSRYINWEDTVLWEVHAEEILWEMALFWDTNRRMATATALTESTLIVILWFSIKELTNSHPELMDKIKTIINDRIMSNKDNS